MFLFFLAFWTEKANIFRVKFLFLLESQALSSSAKLSDSSRIALLQEVVGSSYTLDWGVLVYGWGPLMDAWRRLQQRVPTPSPHVAAAIWILAHRCWTFLRMNNERT